jgi:hypothetical protein
MNFKRQLFAGMSILTAMIFVFGCESEVLPNSGNHPPLQPDQVKIYQKQPKKYEELGMIEVPTTAEMRWDQRGDSTAGFEALKAKAAAMGANGVLLVDPNRHVDKDLDPNRAEGNAAVTAGYKGKFYQVPLRAGTPPTAVAQAIYVLKEE